ncbi:MAG: bacteriohemerythrin [Arenicellales bacterium]|jgi:hemerythrin|nr:bacteriohemerythrin [Arenicellales bacterium]|tara:strand:+ start:252 stop:656 length:405 start_codon:yes stop_codon:yes gene_type:complete
MKKIAWDSRKFSVGHVELDAQHQQLVEMINSCIELSCLPDHSALSMMKHLIKMNNYAQLHFRCEEKILRETGYPLVNAHLELHAEYARKMENLLQSADRDDLREKIYEFLMQWLDQHILKEDMKYKPYMMNKEL